MSCFFLVYLIYNGPTSNAIDAHSYARPKTILWFLFHTGCKKLLTICVWLPAPQHHSTQQNRNRS